MDHPITVIGGAITLVGCVISWLGGHSFPIVIKFHDGGFDYSFSSTFIVGVVVLALGLIARF